MSGMNEYLSDYYGTTSSQVADEEIEKQAQVELFKKLAADQSIDLDQLSDAQVTELWANFQKNASEEDKKEKMDKAKEEHEEKKEAAAKLAEADFLGRVMAHSYVDELKKIAAANSPEEPVEDKEAGAKDIAGKIGLGAGLVGQKAMYHAGQAAKGAKDVAGKAVKAVGEASGASQAHEAYKAHKALKGGMNPAVRHIAEEARSSNLKDVAKRVGVGAAVAGSGAAGYHLGSRKKEASALDELAFESAIQKCAEGNFDTNEAVTRIEAVLQLPMSEQTKIAHVENLDLAIDIRSLELLEMAGYPVTWNQ